MEEILQRSNENYVGNYPMSLKHETIIDIGTRGISNLDLMMDFKEFIGEELFTEMLKNHCNLITTI